MRLALSLLALTLVYARPVVTMAAQVDCEPARCATQAAIAANCPACDAPGINHGRYVSCVARQVKQLVVSGQVPPTCKGKVVRCAARSTCGKPGFVTCNRPIDTCDLTTGLCVGDPTLTCTTDLDCGARCKVARDADHCLAIGGTVGTGSSCCAACQ